MTSFVIHGPFAVDFQKRPGGRTLVFDDFWAEGGDAYHLAGECGCYVFALQNKALTPLYVGKATKTFKQETFNPTNRHKYHNGFSHYAKGSPVMYFVVHPNQKGPTNLKEIAQIENFLIQAGVAKNPDIQNIKGTQKPNWSIRGVIRSSGKSTSVEAQFSTLFDLHK